MLCFDVMFKKSNLIVFNEGRAVDTSLIFNSQVIESVPSESHLGNIIGNNVTETYIKKVTDDFVKRVNVMLGNFKFIYHETKYELFKVFCMSLYGSLLWDYSSAHVNMFYTAWRKCVRRILGLPYRTHNNLLPSICNDAPVDWQLHRRCITFVTQCLNSHNSCVSLCASLCIQGSRSDTCNSVNYICSKYNINKHFLSCNQTGYLPEFDEANNITRITAGAIRDLLTIRDQPNETEFSTAEAQFMIDYLCLD
jgi:hypothetical protein